MPRTMAYIAELRSKGITTTRPTYAWLVKPSVVAIPKWAREHAIKGLSASQDAVWLPRPLSLELVRLDKEDGGRPFRCKMEYRRCQICKRMLVGAAAEQRRRLDEDRVTGRQTPCNDTCLEAHWRRKNAGNARTTATDK